MKHRLLTVAIMLLIVNAVYAQQTDTVKAPPVDTTMAAAPPATEPAPTGASKMYYGGYIGATFGDYSSIEVAPRVGWHLSPVLSAGLGFSYEYLWADVNGQNIDASNYGGSIFAIARVHPKIFLQAEFEYMSYENVGNVNSTDDRQWVPFLYLGGGFVQPLSPNVSLVASVLVDVLQDEHSPYDDWSPEFSIGVIAGF
jgi:hypothetical protein